MAGLLWLVLCVWTGIGPAAAQGACGAEAGVDAPREAFLERLNRFRARNGLPTLRHAPLLGRAAADYACLMAQSGHFAHTGPDGSTPMVRASGAGYSACMLAENIALGQADAAEVFRAWLTSPGHRDNMLLGKVSEIGLGVARAGEIGSAGGLGTLAERLGGVAERGAAGHDAGGRREGRPYWVLLLARPCT